MKQRAVNEFLVAEGKTVVNIHKRLQRVYHDEALDYSNVRRWACRLAEDSDESQQSGYASLKDKSRTGRPSSPVNLDNKANADKLIREDRRITLDELASELGVSHGSAHHLLESLGYSKVFARWVPRQLTDEHKAERVSKCSELIELSERNPTLLERLKTGDETWMRHYEPESKKRSMQWRHTTSPKPKKFKLQKSAGKIMATVFWDAQGLLLVDFLSKGKTINSEAYIETLKKLRARIRRARPQLEMKKVFLQHGNALPHTSIKTRKAITSFGWTTVPHPPYSPDLAHSDYRLRGAMKEELIGKHCADDDEEVKTAARNWLRSLPSEFYKAGIHALILR